jgi:cell division septum initiation protein DivIVA
MILLKDLKKRLKVKKTILDIAFKRGERAKERELDATAKAELDSHRKMMANLRERQEITLSDLQSDCDREVARARKAELEAQEKAAETKQIYTDLINEAENVVEKSKYTANRNVRAAKQALLLIRKLENILADVIQGPHRVEGVEEELGRLITTQREQDKRLYKTRELVN